MVKKTFARTGRLMLVGTEKCLPQRRIFGDIPMVPFILPTWNMEKMVRKILLRDSKQLRYSKTMQSPFRVYCIICFGYADEMGVT